MGKRPRVAPGILEAGYVCVIGTWRVSRLEKRRVTPKGRNGNVFADKYDNENIGDCMCKSCYQSRTEAQVRIRDWERRGRAGC